MKKIVFIYLLLYAVASQAEAIKAVDGDSLEIGSRRIRLDGIDAPEFVQTCQNVENQEYNCGQEALEYIAQLIADKEVDCKCLEQRDKYDREICECFIDGVSINETMVESGWAVSYRSDKYLSAEQKAETNKRGIWQGKYMRPALFRVLNRYRQQSENSL